MAQSSQVQVWPCWLWRHEWFDHFPQNEFGCGELPSLTHPDLIRECHCQLIGGGADAVVTNTFGATSLIMKEYGAEEKVQEANRASARFALEACAQTGAKVGAVGSLGPTTTLLTLSQIPVSVVEQAYFEQALALFEGGIRVFYIEGCQDPLNGCAALTALTRLEDRVATPVQKAVTARVVDNGQMLFGTSLDDFWEVVRPFSPQALGAIGRFDDVRDAIRSLSTLPEARLAAMVDIFAVCFPEGWIESPESLRNKLSSLRDDHDIRVVGTGIISEPDHVRALVEQWDGVVGGRCTVLIDAVGGEGARAT